MHSLFVQPDQLCTYYAVLVTWSFFFLKYKGVDNFAHDISSSTDIFVFFCHCLQHLNIVCLCFSSRWCKPVDPLLHTFTFSIIHRVGPVSHVLFRTLLSKPFLFFTTHIGRQLWLWYVALFFMTCPVMAVISTYCKLLCHTWWLRAYVCALIDSVCLIVLLQAVQDLLISKLHPRCCSVSCKSYSCSPTLSPGTPGGNIGWVLGLGNS